MLTKIEKALNTSLISDTVGTKYKIEFNRSTLPYYKDVLSTYEKQLQLGVLSVNDIRKIHNQNPIDGGDDVLVSTNLQAVGNYKVNANTLLEEEQVTENGEVLD